MSKTLFYIYYLKIKLAQQVNLMTLATMIPSPTILSPSPSQSPSGAGSISALKSYNVYSNKQKMALKPAFMRKSF